MQKGKVGSVSIVVRQNPHYIPSLTKDWLVIDAGTCVGQFDNEAEANAHCETIVEGKPKREESTLSRYQELKNEYRNTPRKEIKKRRELKAELKLIKAQEGHTKEKTQAKQVKKVETTTETKESPLTEAYKVLLPKTYHYHKKTSSHPGRRGRCTCKEGADNE